MTEVQSIIIGIVEGITEFIPISSTGHMIIAEKLLKINDDAFNTVFTVAIQLGAILSVVVLYWKKFFDFSRWQFSEHRSRFRHSDYRYSSVARSIFGQSSRAHP